MTVKITNMHRLLIHIDILPDDEMFLGLCRIQWQQKFAQAIDRIDLPMMLAQGSIDKRALEEVERTIKTHLEQHLKKTAVFDVKRYDHFLALDSSPTKRVLINTQHGGFSLSDLAREEFSAATGLVIDKDIKRNDIELRTHPEILAFVDKHGLEEAAGHVAKLGIAKVPDDGTEYQIEEYDGLEWVAQKHEKYYEE